MGGRKDLKTVELETVRVSESPTTVVTANGAVLTKEEATVYVRELDLFVTVMLLEDTLAVLSPGKLCEGHRYNSTWTSSQNPHPIKNGQKDRMQHSELRTIRCLWSNDKLFKLIFTYFSNIFIAGHVTPTEHPASTRSERMSEEVRGNSSHDLPEWLEEFKENLVDDSVPEHRDASSSSHELLSEPRVKKWYPVSIAFLLTSEGPKLRYLLEDKNYEGF